jgi:hypothetical protein
MTRVGKARGWLLSMNGLRWGGEKPHESAFVRASADTRCTGNTPKWGPSLRKVTSSSKTGALGARDREVGGTTRRER